MLNLRKLSYLSAFMCILTPSKGMDNVNDDKNAIINTANNQDRKRKNDQEVTQEDSKKVKVVSPRFELDPKFLPRVIWAYILKNFNQFNILKMREVCKYFNNSVCPKMLTKLEILEWMSDVKYTSYEKYLAAHHAKKGVITAVTFIECKPANDSRIGIDFKILKALHSKFQSTVESIVNIYTNLKAIKSDYSNILMFSNLINLGIIDDADLIQEENTPAILSLPESIQNINYQYNQWDDNIVLSMQHFFKPLSVLNNLSSLSIKLYLEDFPAGAVERFIEQIPTIPCKNLNNLTLYINEIAELPLKTLSEMFSPKISNGYLDISFFYWQPENFQKVFFENYSIEKIYMDQFLLHPEADGEEHEIDVFKNFKNLKEIEFGSISNETNEFDVTLNFNFCQSVKLKIGGLVYEGEKIDVTVKKSSW